MSDEILPSDIDKDSRCRLPFPVRDQLEGKALEIYDRHSEPDGGSLAGLFGPGGIKLHSPRLAELSQPTGHYLRHETGLPEQIRELAILVTAREMDSQFEWAAHEPEAKRVGLSEQAIDVVRHSKDPAGLPEIEQTIVTFGRQLFRDRHVSSDVYAAALAHFGERKLVDLVAIMANYAATAALLAAFDVHLAEGKKPELPVS
jgi:4-carboxymuconolactone decarboxylase